MGFDIHKAAQPKIELTAHKCMQAHFQQSYADNSAEELLGVLHQLDADRLRAALHQAMAVRSGGYNRPNFHCPSSSC